MATFYALLNKGKAATTTTYNIAENDTYEIEFEYKILSGSGNLFGNSGNSYSKLQFLSVRDAVQVIGASLSFPLVEIPLSGYDKTSYNKFRLVRYPDQTIEFFINDVSQNTPVLQTGNFLINRIGAVYTSISPNSGLRYLKFTRNGALERHYISSTNDTAVLTEIISGSNATLIGAPEEPFSQYWEMYTVSAGTVEFTGNIDNQLVLEGSSGSFNVSDGFSGSGTPFTYSSIGTALPAEFTLNASTGQVSYVNALASMTSGHIIQATAQDSTTAISNSFSIEVSNAASLVPQGTVTITSVTTSEITGNVAWTYDLADATDYEYSLNSGAAQYTLSNPHTIADLTPGTTNNVRVRATNQYGPGAWSASVDFTTKIVLSLTTEVIRNETLTVLRNILFTVVDVISQSTGELVVRFTNVTSSPSGTITLSDPSFQHDTVYRVYYELPNGEAGSEKVTIPAI